MALVFDHKDETLPLCVSAALFDVFRCCRVLCSWYSFQLCVDGVGLPFAEGTLQGQPVSAHCFLDARAVCWHHGDDWRCW